MNNKIKTQKICVKVRREVAAEQKTKCYNILAMSETMGDLKMDSLGPES